MLRLPPQRRTDRRAVNEPLVSSLRLHSLRQVETPSNAPLSSAKRLGVARRIRLGTILRRSARAFAIASGRGSPIVLRGIALGTVATWSAGPRCTSRAAAKSSAAEAATGSATGASGTRATKWSAPRASTGSAWSTRSAEAEGLRFIAFRFSLQLRCHRCQPTGDELSRWQGLPELSAAERASTKGAAAPRSAATWSAATWSTATWCTSGAAAKRASAASFSATGDCFRFCCQRSLQSFFQLVEPGEESFFGELRLQHLPHDLQVGLALLGDGQQSVDQGVLPCVRMLNAEFHQLLGSSHRGPRRQ